MTKERGHWAKFSDAIRDLRSYNDAPEFAHFRKAASRLLEVAPRFYFPDGAYVLEGKLIDDEVKALLRMPYEAISVLSECTISDAPDGLPAKMWMITLAVDPRSELNRFVGLINPDNSAEITCALLSIVLAPTYGFWILEPLIASFKLIKNGPGYQIGLFDDGQGTLVRMEKMAAERGHKLDRDWAEQSFRENASVIMNLCALLGTSVAKPTPVMPPEKLNKRREMRGQAPLYDYHVLTVDGERWDSPFETGSGTGVRSHLRRGHIRRLSPERFTWVRSTLVRGSVRGFVAKDYEVKAPAQ